MVTDGPEALSFAAWKTAPLGSVPTPSRWPPTSTARAALFGSGARSTPTTLIASTSWIGVSDTLMRMVV